MLPSLSHDKIGGRNLTVAAGSAGASGETLGEDNSKFTHVFTGMP